jgi:hypothetical protein
MKYNFINLTHSEYLDIYRVYKYLLNPDDNNIGSGFVTNFSHMHWHKLGLRYSEADARGRWFEVLDIDKWKKHLMLTKIAKVI